MGKIYAEQRSRRLKSWAARGAAMAAVFACGIIFCMSNPSFASELPLVGHIFEKMQNSFFYQGDYNGIGEKLEEDSSGAENAGEKDEAEKTENYTKTVDGITVTLSEMYSNDQALYVTVQIQSKDGFPEISGFSVNSTQKYSFMEDTDCSAPTLEGEFIDGNTFAGLLRFDLNEVRLAMAYESGKAQNLYSQMDIPDTFSVELKLNQIVGALTNTEKPDLGKTKEELDAMSDEEWKKYMMEWDAQHPDYYADLDAVYDGPWTFNLDVTKNASDTQIVEINDQNELGIGFSRVIKDRFEISMYDSYADPEDMGKYFPVMLDADGRLMYGNDGLVQTVAINDWDVSKVDLFLIDENLWLDEIKGIYWNQPDAETYDGKTFKEILLENCAYHREVSFEE